MLKDQLEYLVKLQTDLTGPMLRRSRDEDGDCNFCGSKRGDRHLPDCFIWPLIEWRAAYNGLNDLGKLPD